MFDRDAEHIQGGLSLPNIVEQSVGAHSNDWRAPLLKEVVSYSFSVWNGPTASVKRTGAAESVVREHLVQHANSPEWHASSMPSIMRMSSQERIPYENNIWYQLYHGVPKFSPYGSVCCACYQRPGLTRQSFSRMLRSQKCTIFSMGPKRRHPRYSSVIQVVLSPKQTQIAQALTQLDVCSGICVSSIATNIFTVCRSCWINTCIHTYIHTHIHTHTGDEHSLQQT